MSDLVADLLDPASYPEPRPDSVELRTTHGSWVFLAGERAYKVKRPVNYGFLDFSTPELREHFCREEVRLNRRMAPDVYLDVVPIHEDDGRRSFTGPGRVVDHAVVMARLPDEATLRSILARGDLTPREIQAVASRLVAFHAACPVVRQAPRVFADNVQENFDQLRPYAGTFVDEELLHEVRTLQLDQVSAHEDWLEMRSAHGHVRDGHGDLRLEHVYLVDGQPVVLDCIDFNERFRQADAALDVGFLAMDLDHELRPDLSDWLMARYAMAANDYDLYRLLDLYKGYRAVVRAKVACFVANDPGVAEDKKLRKLDEAAQHMALAASYGRPAARWPGVIAVAGIVGTGKSSVADLLSRELRLPVVGSDATRKHLAGIAATEKGGAEIYTSEFSDRTFRELFRRAGAVMASGRGVILDATFRSRELRGRARELAASHGRPFLLVETICEEAVVRQRLRERAREASVSDAGEELYDRFRTTFEPVTELGAREHVVVDTAKAYGDLPDRVRACVSR